MRALKHRPRQKPFFGIISIAFPVFRSVFFVSFDCFFSWRFNVPKNGSKPSFLVICFLTHGSFRNLVPPPCPLDTLP